MSKERQELPGEVASALRDRGINPAGEVYLREALERYVPGYTLYRLTPAAARRWKCRYRVMLELGYFDGQSAAEAYARALLATLDAQERATSTAEERG